MTYFADLRGSGGEDLLDNFVFVGGVKLALEAGL